MKLPRVRFTMRRIMAVVAALAFALAAMRVVVVYLPHSRKCLRLAACQERVSLAFRRTASHYRSCIRAVPCSPSEYCHNACLDHASSTSPPSDPRRASAAAEHKRAVDDHERAADWHAAMAVLYRRAVFRWSQPIPDLRPGPDVDLSERYRCDYY